MNGLRFRGNHGVFESERAYGNDFIAFVIAEVDGRADVSDELLETVDYAGIAGLLLEVSSSKSFMTVEGLAGAFCRAVLERYPMVKAIEASIDKVAPQMDADVESCGVRLRLERP